MNVADYRWLSQAENITVVEQILGRVGKAFAACRRLIQAIFTNGRAHRAIKHQNALGEGLGEFSGAVGLRHTWRLPARNRGIKDQIIIS